MIMRRLVTGFAAAMTVIAWPASFLQAQPCNPIVDGTYCATNGPAPGASSGSGGGNGGLANMMMGDMMNSASGGNNPGMFGGATFSGGTSCANLLWRTRCN